MKRMAANRAFRFHAKFRVPMLVEWMGRVVTTLNADEESARMIPELGLSLMDKIMLFRTVSEPLASFGSHEENDAMLVRELPHFAAFLLHWEIPEDSRLLRQDGKIDHRFGGFKPWHEQDIVTNANQSSRLTSFIELLADWKAREYEALNVGKTGKKDLITQWEGTAFQLRRKLIEVCGTAASETLRALDHGDVGKLLTALKAKGYQLECSASDDNELRVWKVSLT